MAHHSSEHDAEMMKRFMERMGEQDVETLQALNEEVKNKYGNGLGATGRFPEGKLTLADEGEIQFAVTTIKKKVVIDFGKPVRWLGCTGDQAIDLGRLLIKRGRKLLKTVE